MPATPSELFQELSGHFDPEKWGDEDALLAFEISGDNGGNWVATIEDGKLSVRDGAVDDADMTMVCSDEDLMAMVHGDLNPVSAFMAGKVRIKGNMSLAMKLQTFLTA